MAAAVALPLGAALGFDGPVVRSRVRSVPAMVRTSEPRQPARPLPEARNLALTGGLLIGLAALVRRTT